MVREALHSDDEASNVSNAAEEVGDRRSSVSTSQLYDRTGFPRKTKELASWFSEKKAETFTNSPLTANNIKRHETHMLGPLTVLVLSRAIPPGPDGSSLVEWPAPIAISPTTGKIVSVEPRVLPHGEFSSDATHVN